MRIEEQVVFLLKEAGMTVATAESCSGGLLSGTLVNVSGASEVFESGIVTYSNEAKEQFLHVPHHILTSYGAVSRETAAYMAKGIAAVTSADLGISVTGIAGPLGGTKEKPVGLVYIGIYDGKRVWTFRYRFSGNRKKVRTKTVNHALYLLAEYMHLYKG